jgi:uncharacterized glyoxalase superfamily metalloenzyme YdcJ
MDYRSDLIYPSGHLKTRFGEVEEEMFYVLGFPPFIYFRLLHNQNCDFDDVMDAMNRMVAVPKNNFLLPWRIKMRLS